MLEMRHLRLDDKALIERYIPDCCKQMCDFTFGNLYSWSAAEHTEIAEKEGFLFLHSTFNGVTSYAFPWGNGDVKNALSLVVSDSQKRGADLSFFCVAEEQLRELKAFFGESLVVKEQRDYFDYVYSAERLSNLSGRKLHSKKNHVNSFNRKYKYNFEEINQGNIQECLAFSHRWFMECDSNQRLEAERQVIDCALRNYHALGFKGALLRINGQVEAYCLGEPMADGEAFCTHFEKASAEFPGAYAVINKLFAEMLSGEYKLINREDDAGVEGLRKAKTSYQPEYFVKKYYAKVV